MPLDALAFGAHPDDVELSCSGTLIKLSLDGYKTGVISLTAGELGTRGSAEVRAQEFQESARIMGLSSHSILGIADGRVCTSWENKLSVIREIRVNRPRLVFAPYWEDRHPDHVATSKLVLESAFLAGLRKIDTGQEAHRPHKVAYYPCRLEFQPSFVIDITESHGRKLEAIQAYRSQFHNPEQKSHGEAETNISHPRFLEAILARDKRFGSYIGTEYGEAFLVREPLRLDDPVAFFGSECLDSFL